MSLSDCCSTTHLPPQYQLGQTVFFSVQEAVYAARAEANLPGWFHMDAPATSERLRMACADELTAPFAPAAAACRGSF